VKNKGNPSEISNQKIVLFLAVFLDILKDWLLWVHGAKKNMT
jgi:hypothetical protein